MHPKDYNFEKLGPENVCAVFSGSTTSKEICPTCPAAPPLFISFLSILGLHSFYYLDLLSIPYEKTQIVKTFTILTTAADVVSLLPGYNGRGSLPGVFL